MSPEAQGQTAPAAPLVPKLRSDIRLRSSGPDHSGADSWTLFDPVSDRYFKIGQDDYALLSMLDRPQTLERLRERLEASGARWQAEESLRSLESFSAHGLLELPYGSDKGLFAKREMIKEAKLANWLLSAYLFLDIPLLRPDAFFSRTAPRVLKAFNKWTLGALAVLALLGYASLLPRSEALSAFFWRSLDLNGMAGYALALLLIKGIHECAHAYAAKAQGIRVRRMGVAFIVFWPRLYTDLTDAWSIPKRSGRALIDGAGIASELVLGGFAAMLWSHSAPGPLNTAAYYIFAVSAVNTVFINGNPFIKYDGYYLLMDLIGIDNLYSRGVSLLRAKLRSWALGIPEPPAQDGFKARGWKGVFLACFALSSVVYRLFLYTSIILIVYLQFTKALGIALFALEAYVLMLKPLIAECRGVFAARTRIDRKRLAASVCVVAALAIALLIPLPWRISMRCETRPAASQAVCAKDDGFLESLDAEDGQAVKKGQAVLSQGNPFLEWERKDKTLQAKMEALELDQMRSDKKRLAGKELQTRKLEQAKAARAEAERRLATLSVKAAQDGVFSLADKRLRPGKWLFAGDSVGEIFDPASTEAIAYAEESEVSRIAPGSKAKVFLEGSLESHSGKVVSVNKVPSKNPDAASPLLDAFGGPLQTLRSPSEDLALRFQAPLYMVRIALDEPAAASPGRTGLAKVANPQSLAATAFRSVLSALQRELSF